MVAWYTRYWSKSERTIRDAQTKRCIAKRENTVGRRRLAPSADERHAVRAFSGIRRRVTGCQRRCETAIDISHDTRTSTDPFEYPRPAGPTGVRGQEICQYFPNDP